MYRVQCSTGVQGQQRLSMAVIKKAGSTVGAMRVPVERKLEFKEVVSKSRLSPFLRRYRSAFRRRTLSRIANSSRRKSVTTPKLKFTTKKRKVAMASAQLNGRQPAVADQGGGPISPGSHEDRDQNEDDSIEVRYYGGRG